jgi:hypothetical protein
MTTGALPVGLISLSDKDPEGKEGYEASGDDNRLKLSKGKPKCSDQDTLVAKVEALLPESKRESSSNFRRF